MADIIDEIDGELRRDKVQEWWKKHGKIVIAGCLIVIAATGGVTLYETQRTARLRALADRYAGAVALIAEDPASAADALSGLAAEAEGEGVALIARFRAAGVLSEAGDHAAAAAAFETIAADGSVDPLYRDLAAVKGILQAAVAGEDRAQLLQEIEPLATDSAPWRFTARMIAASLAIGLDDMDAASDYLKQVADDPEAPNSARGQAAEILRALEN